MEKGWNEPDFSMTRARRITEKEGLERLYVDRATRSVEWIGTLIDLFVGMHLCTNIFVQTKYVDKTLKFHIYLPGETRNEEEAVAHTIPQHHSRGVEYAMSRRLRSPFFNRSMAVGSLSKKGRNTQLCKAHLL